MPLSDDYHLRKDYGTRHRAAIGASEMGDAIAIVVSEERGSIGLTLEGRLYILENADALRTLLHKLLAPGRAGVGASLSNLFRTGRRLNQADLPEADADSKTASADVPVQEAPPDSVWKPRSSAAGKPVRKNRILLTIASLAIAIVIWLYVQVTINPIDTRTFTVPLTYENIDAAESKGYTMQFPLKSIQVTLMGRKQTITDLKSDQVKAYLDFAQVEGTGRISLNVQVNIGGLLYLRTTTISPSTIPVSVWTKSVP